jgi:hypothetical protein
MRLAAKQTRSQLEWSILDVEQEEWDQQVASLDVTAAANGFPVYVRAKQAEADSENGGRLAPKWHPTEMGRWIMLVGAAALILSLVAGYAVWRTAQEGIVRMQGDVVNAVKLETVRAHTGQTAPHIQEAVQAVTFKDDKAMAAVVVTHRLPNGHAVTRPETHFYLLTAKGWQRTRPQAEFWGPAETLDTASLHFVFGSTDRVVVEQTAAGAEALYATLRQATGEDLAAGGLLNVELVPDELLNNEQADAGHIRLASPAFTDRGVALPRGDIFVLLQLRHALARRLLEGALQKSAPRAQWSTVVEAFGSWLQLSSAGQPSLPSELAALPRLGGGTAGVLRPEDLLDREGRYAAAEQSGAYQTYEAVYTQGQRWAAAVQMIDFLASKYGIDVLPRLLRGFSQYDDWETLAPAVLGVSAEELEAAWRADAVDTATRP